MVIFSKAFDEFLNIDENLRLIEKRINKKVMDFLLDFSKPLGYLKWLSSIKGYNLKFEGLNFKLFINLRSFKVNIIKIIQSIKENSNDNISDINEIENALNELVRLNHKPEYICSGKDMIKVLLILISKFINNEKNHYNFKKLRDLLINKYDFGKFKITNLYNQIIFWENSNFGYKVF